MIGKYIKYAVAGGLAALVHLAIYIGLVEWFQLNYVLASSIGFVAAIAVNYSLQYRYVFASDSPHKITFAKYLSVTLVFMLVNILCIHLLTNVLGWNYVLSQILVIGLISIGNFTVNRRYTYA